MKPVFTHAEYELIRFALHPNNHDEARRNAAYILFTDKARKEALKEPDPREVEAEARRIAAEKDAEWAKAREKDIAHHASMRAQGKTPRHGIRPERRVDPSATMPSYEDILARMKAREAMKQPRRAR
jgi:hypothetical protein